MDLNSGHFDLGCSSSEVQSSQVTLVYAKLAMTTNHDIGVLPKFGAVPMVKLITCILSLCAWVVGGMWKSLKFGARKKNPKMLLAVLNWPL